MTALTPVELAGVLRAALETIEPHRTRIEELCAEHFIAAAGWTSDAEYDYRTEQSGMRDLLAALAAVERLGDTYEDVAHRLDVSAEEERVRNGRRARLT